MTQYLPPNLLALFAPRDPIPHLPPIEKISAELRPYTGVATFLGQFEDPKDTPPPTRVETRDERKERKRRERAEQIAYKLEQDLALWDPATDINATSDPYKTLFIARINFDTSESKLRREFEVYGPIRMIRLVTDKLSNKPRGYAFIEYEHERDMHSAYKHADGKKIDGRRVLVDVMRSRTVKGWRPRRLGGGLGSTRKGGPDVNSRFSGRDDMSGGGGRGRSPSPYSGGGGVGGGGPGERERGGGMGGGGGGGERGMRRKRSRSRERRRSRSRDRERRRSREREDRRRRRSRSRDRDRSRRSRSRDRKRSRRSRSPRERRSRSEEQDDQYGGGADGQRNGSGKRDNYDDGNQYGGAGDDDFDVPYIKEERVDDGYVENDQKPFVGGIPDEPVSD
ncbi:U1 small nuclear ribonucleoprotein 70 kDa-like [Tubulanus polymorphus]|uniref:U1 small nuclear ribonucleoprotein 70 kDa-like n=1 Tax=Tubulanus polymorphus TaxID=672921 RepID=UPI003DA61778